jgi:hypothetical protein
MDLTLVLIFRILATLFKGMMMIALWSVCREGLECLVAAIRRSRALLLPLAFVVVVAAIAVVATLPLLVLTIVRPALPAMVAVTPMFRDMEDLFLITLHECVAEIAFCVILNLMLAFPCKGAMGYLQVEDVLEVFCNRLKSLVAKVLPAFNILCAILGVVQHVEPLKL